jgi:hypothetical protein
MATQQETQPVQVASPLSQPEVDPRPQQRRRFSLRGFTSLLLSFSFLAMCLSGAMLFLTPRGRTANWTDWSLIGLDKHQWGSVHVNNSVVFVAIAVLHLVLNWSVFMRYIKKKAATGLNLKKEMALAAVLAAVVVVGPISSIPPFSTLMAVNEDIKNYWDQTAQQPPVPHAEELTLAELAKTIKLSVEQVSTALKDEGYDVEDAEQTIGEIGQQKGVAPSAVFDVIRERHPTSRGWGRVNGQAGGGHGPSAGGSGNAGSGNGTDHGSPGGKRSGAAGNGRQGGGPGKGRGQGAASGTATDVRQLTVNDVSAAVGLTIDEVLAALIDAGFDPKDETTTLGQLSDQQSTSPQDVLDAIHDRFPDTRGWGRITGGRGGH